MTQHIHGLVQEPVHLVRVLVHELRTGRAVEHTEQRARDVDEKLGEEAPGEDGVVARGGDAYPLEQRRVLRQCRVQGPLVQVAGDEAVGGLEVPAAERHRAVVRRGEPRHAVVDHARVARRQLASEHLAMIVRLGGDEREGARAERGQRADEPHAVARADGTDDVRASPRGVLQVHAESGPRGHARQERAHRTSTNHVDIWARRGRRGRRRAHGGGDAPRLGCPHCVAARTPRDRESGNALPTASQSAREAGPGLRWRARLARDDEGPCESAGLGEVHPGAEAVPEVCHVLVGNARSGEAGARRVDAGCHERKESRQVAGHVAHGGQLQASCTEVTNVV
mmetsp:Transcript_142619/g.397394  ORF Transcript_142619/g.397394 Transcript_142619/m.397394 type:complete len:339 (-) Transcript_142619:1814-2830(-)